MLNKRVHIVGELHDNAIQKFEEAGYVLSRSKNLDDNQLLKLAYDAQVIVLTDMVFQNEWFAKLPHLKLIARRGAGYDNVAIDIATSYGVLVTNTPGANAIAVAELTITLILNTLRHIKKIMVDDSRYNDVSHVFGHNLNKKKVGIVGYGRIAQHVEAILSGFGVNILVYSHHKVIPKYATFVDFQTLVSQSDIITLHVPAVRETEHMINHDVFLHMKQDAILINTARGLLVDEKALIDALKTHQILGAGLDTVQNEPLSVDSDLRHQDGILLTPHIGANTVEAEYLTGKAVMENVIDFFENRQPSNAVNQLCDV